MSPETSEAFRSLSHLIDVLADETEPNTRHRRLAGAMGDALDRIYSAVLTDLEVSK